MREQILKVAEVYGEARGIGRKRVSTMVLNRGSKLDNIAEGGDLATGTFERAMRWFSLNWPEGAVWPEGVPRPDVEAEPSSRSCTAAAVARTAAAATRSRFPLSVEE